MIFLEYISARDAANKWGISQRQVALLCAESRIPYATMVGNMWIIPASADKPADAMKVRCMVKDDNIGKPFLKWAGGKGQLLKDISALYPFEDATLKKYAEPFVGGGAVLFDILNRYELDQVYINDINGELMNAYHVVKNNAHELLDVLYKYQEEFIPLDHDGRKEYFSSKRERFNELKGKFSEGSRIELAALMIFLNKTCFNGLYRVNKKGLYNVPMGKYKNPLICDEKNILLISEKLRQVKIECGSYKQCLSFVDAETFVYFDPPYRPLTPTASFTSYTEGSFNDDDQRELAEFVTEVDDRGALFVLSNSDPRNVDSDDSFFDELYEGYNIKRIGANRMINSKGSKRGRVTELLISNF